MDQKQNIDRFLNGTGQITQLPKKQLVRQAVLEYLAEKFETERNYSEQEVNEICAQWHTFNDYFTLRRELVERGLLHRERDGSRYWKPVLTKESEDGQ